MHNNEFGVLTWPKNIIVIIIIIIEIFQISGQPIMCGGQTSPICGGPTNTT